MFIKVKDNFEGIVYLNINHIRAIYRMTPDNRKAYYSIYFSEAEDNYMNISEDEFNKIKKYIELETLYQAEIKPIAMCYHK